MNIIAAPLTTSKILTGLLPYNGTWGLSEVKHLLKRTMFGAKDTDIDYLLSMGNASSAVDYILQNTGFSPPEPINNYNHLEVDSDVAVGQSFVNAPYNNTVEYYRSMSYVGWWINLMRYQNINIEEKLILFWSNHIPIQTSGVFSGPKLYRYHNTLRQNSKGNFRTLIKAITLDPGMLTYLNGQYNNKYAPDENYGRELQELFCIGKGPGSQYTEDDVRAAARVLTGWRVTSDYTIYFDETWHDTNDKQFSAFYGNTLIAGQMGPNGGMTELDAMIDMLLATQECAKFICRKIYRFFVHHLIDAQVETDIIEPLADIFRQGNYEIMPVLDALFKSEHFFNMNYRAAMLKSPIDFLIGLMRENDMPYPDQNLIPNDFWTVGTDMAWLLNSQQQFPNNPPNVAGWPAYYQEPVFDKLWITTDSLPKRASFIDWMVWSQYSTLNFEIKIDCVELAASFANPADPYQLIDDALERYYCIDVNQDVRDYLLAILLTGQTNPSYWTGAWSDYLSDPTNVMFYNTVQYRLRVFFRYIFILEEHQLM